MLTIGCSLLLLNEDFSGDPVASPDAASDGPPEASGAFDATADTRTDGPGPGDADGGPPDPCAAEAHFCDDFERSDLLGAWTGLRSSIDAGVGGSAQAHLTKDLAVGTRSRFVWAFDFEMVTPPSPGLVFAQLGLFQASTLWFVYLYAQPGGVAFVQQDIGGGGLVQIPLPAPYGVRHRLEVDLTIGGRVVLAVDGVVSTEQQTEAFMTSGEPRLDLGLLGAPLSPSPFSVRLDDLRLAMF